jgi:serine/threonine-protein kinase
MGVSDAQRSIPGSPPDLLAVIRRSGVLNDRQFEEVCTKVTRGEYPRDSSTLAACLVAEQFLTEFQASRLLRNKTTRFVIGPYVILDRLGEGSKGRVFKAQHKLMGRLVALKIIAPHLASRSSSIARFHREIRLLGRLDHPNVVRAFDADQIGEHFYLVMEYVAGLDLERLLEDRGTLSPSEVATFMAQAALGLGHAHDRGIVHRDIKPTNLILSDEGQVKVLDLGLGALIESDSQTSFATAAGHSVGTLRYMSPEQARAGEVDGRSDLFSLGCTMYYLLSGQAAFPGETVVECLKRRAIGHPIPITDLRPDLPPRLVEVLDKLMANRPEDRFQRAAAAAEALQAMATKHTADACPDRLDPSHPAVNSLSRELHARIAETEPSVNPMRSISFASAPTQSRPMSSPAALPTVETILLLEILGLMIFIIGFVLGVIFRHA